MVHGSFALRLFLLSALAATPLAAQSGSTAGAMPKFAFIDSRVVIEKAPGRAAAESTFQREYDAARQQIEKMQDTLQAMIAAYQKSQSTMTAVNRELREKEIRDKQNLFETRANLLDQQMQRRQSELVQPIMAQVRQVLDSVRVQEGYTFIFDVGTQVGVIVAADKQLDITDKVIARLKPISPLSPKADSAKAPGLKPTPSGVTKPVKPPTS
jgi:outer membrane protein